MTAGKQQEFALGWPFAVGQNQRSADHGQRQACIRYAAIANRKKDFPSGTSPVHIVPWCSQDGRSVLWSAAPQCRLDAQTMNRCP